MFLHVTSVSWLGEYLLRVEFNNGIINDVNLSNELYGEVFEPLREREVFAKVAINHETRTIEWSNGADLAPEFLYEMGRDVRQVT